MSLSEEQRHNTNDAGKRHEVVLVAKRGISPYFLFVQGDFYRSIPKKKRLKTLLKGITKNRRKALAALVVTLALVYLLFDNKGIIKRVSLEMQRSEMIARVEEAQKETLRLQTQKKALEGDKKTIEKIAREKYGMSRAGETVYRVKKD